MALRPKRSAIMPNKMAPTAIPIELTLPIQPISTVLNCHSLCKAAITKLSMPTSMASNSQAMPIPIINRVWLGAFFDIVIPLEKSNIN